MPASDNSKTYTPSDYFAQKAAREQAQQQVREQRQEQRQQAIQQAYSKASEKSKQNLYYPIEGMGKKDVEAARGYKSFAEKRYTPETLKKPESKPVFTTETIEATKSPQSRIDQPTPVMRGGAVVGVQDPTLKQSYYISPVSKSDFTTYQAEANIRTKRQEDVSRNRAGVGSVSMDSYNRLAGLEGTKQAQGEIRSEKTAIDWTTPYSALKTSYPLLGRTSSKLEYEAFKTENPFERQAKRFGAVAFGAAESFSYPLLFPVEATKQTVSSLFHPVETAKTFGEGLIIEPGRTVGQTGGSILFGEFLGKALKPSVAKPEAKILVEESGSKRITTDFLTTDVTQTSVSAVINKRQTVDLRGVAVQDIFKLDDNLYGIKGQAEVFKLNKRTPSGSQLAFSDIVGVGQKVDGGFDALLYSKSRTMGKPVTYSRTAVQTADLMSEPYQVFKEVSITQNINKAPKLKSVGFGVTSEIGVLDIAEPRNFLRKTILTESGEPLAVEQYLGTDRGTIGAKAFGEQFEYKRYNKMAQAVQEQNLLGKVEGTDVRKLSSGSQILKGAELKSVQTSSQTLSTLQKETLKGMAEQNLASQMGKAAALKVAGSSAALFSSKSTSYKPTTATKAEIKDYTISQPRQREYSTTRTYYDMGVSPKQILRSNPFEKSLSKLQPKSIIKPMNILEPKQMTQQKQALTSSQVYKSYNIFKQAQKQIPIPEEIITPFPMAFRYSPETRTKKKGKAYIALLKRRGKFKRISSPTSLKSALDIGTGAAVKTLGATFKIKEVGGEPLDISTGGEFSKYRGMFRSFKLRKGSRQPLEPLTFIQKRGTRLGSIGEITEIQRARKVRMFG